MSPAGTFQSKGLKRKGLKLSPAQAQGDCRQKTEGPHACCQPRPCPRSFNRVHEEGVVGTPGHKFVTDHVSRQRARTPGDEVGQKLVTTRPETSLAQVRWDGHPSAVPPPARAP